MENKTIFFKKWLSTGHLDGHLAKSLELATQNNLRVKNARQPVKRKDIQGDKEVISKQ